MEGSLPNTSVPVVQHTRANNFLDHFFRISTIVFVSFLLGFIGHMIARKASYNRIVVFNQPAGTSVHLSSVRMKEAGFVVIFMQGDGGWSPVGVSWYLPAGYYTDMIIDIGLHQDMYPEDKDNDLGNFVPRNFVAQIYKDKGRPMVFDDDSSDERVLDAFGSGVYQKRFWFRPAGSTIRSFFSQLWDNPLGFGFDALFPY